jgi:hypothetical protein
MVTDSVIPVCDCGKTTGASKVGVVCEHCNSPVKAVVDLFVPSVTSSLQRMRAREVVKNIMTGPAPEQPKTPYPRHNPVRLPDAYERTIWGLEKRGKTYSIDQLLRGRYVLRRKGKALRQHKLTSKGRLHLGLREILAKEPRLLVTVKRGPESNKFVV